MKVYLAGPMRGIPEYNFPAFKDAAKQLRDAGIDVLSPAEHDLEEGFDPTLSLEENNFSLEASMEWDLAAVLESNAVVVLPGWQKSTGVGHEVAVARITGRPVLEYPSLQPVEQEAVTEEASRLVHGARQSAYGHPYDDFTRTGKMWAGVLRDWAITVTDTEHVPDVPPHLVGLCQVALKISREVNGHKRDNLVDIAGYSETVNLVRERQSEQA